MHLFHTPRLAALKPALLLALSLSAFGSAPARAAEPRVSLPRHAAQAPALRGARLLGRVAADSPLHLALTLPLRNQADLDTLLRRQYTPGDAQYGQFLTSDEFVARFGPTEEDYETVAAWAQSHGLTVTGTHAGRTVLDIAGTTAQVEAAFAIRMNRYQASDGRVVFANSGAPRVARSVAVRLAGVAGLSSISRMRPHFRRLRPGGLSLRPTVPVGGGGGIGSGPAGGLSPNDVKYAYALNTITPLYGSTAGTTGTAALLDGAGQRLGLFELDSFLPTDIALFVKQFSLPTILPQAATATTAAVLGTVQPVPVDNFNVAGTTGAGRLEVTLDIDMMLALAPNAAAIYSYEGNQTTTPSVALDIFQRMADDTALDGSGKPLVQVISNSWGLPEADEDPAVLAAENTIFQKMAAQGQSIFSSSGDFGAYDQYDPLTKVLGPISVDSPASQPFVTAVGGTTLSYSKPTTNAATGVTSVGSYVSESVWKTGTVNNATGPEGGGGGTSAVWPKPSYQVGLGASPLSRDLPDVSLDANPDTGYDVYFNGAAVTVGGTSAAAPLWAAFTALVNQQRGLNGLTTTLGFANPVLYGLGQSTSYTTLFHDVTLGDNLFYSAGVGFDDATGFGSFIGAPLVAALSVNADQGTGVATLTGLISDSGGNPISGVTVTATSIATGAVKATATTGVAGTYTLAVPGGLALTIKVDTSTIPAGGTNYASPTPVTLTLTAGATTAQNFVLTAAQTFAAGLQMISAPYDFAGLGDFATLFGLSTPLANPNPRLIQWQPTLGVYVFYPTAPADTLRLGQAYWIKFPSANYLHRLGTPASLTQSFRIPLVAGWNQIGDPFLGSVSLSTVTADTAAGSSAVTLTAAASPVQPNLFRYDPGTGAYVAVDATSGTLDPYNGYWIYAKQAAVLIVPPVAGPPPPPGGTPTPPAAPGG